MPIFTADQLLTKATAAQMKAQIYTFLDSTGVSTTAWQPLSPLRALVDVFSRLAAIIQNAICDANRGGFRDTANADWLATTSHEMYGVDKFDATFATGPITLINSGGGVYAFNPGELVIKNPTTEKTYTNTTLLNLGALATLTDQPIQAQEAGADSNSAAGQITSMVTQALGVTCTNSSFVTGSDAEREDDLRARDLAALGALSPNGAIGAYEYVALTPALNGGIAVNRATLLPPPGDGTLSLLIASPTGTISPGEVAVVQGKIDNLSTPADVTTIVSSAVPYGVNYIVDVWLYALSGLSEAAVTTMVQKAVFDYIESIPIGGTKLDAGIGKVLWRGVEGAIKAASPDIDGTTKPIIQAKLLSEADIAIGATNVVTMLPTDTAVVVHFV